MSLLWTFWDRKYSEHKSAETCYRGGEFEVRRVWTLSFLVISMKHDHIVEIELRGALEKLFVSEAWGSTSKLRPWRYVIAINVEDFF
jgi:hypothetical protein